MQILQIDKSLSAKLANLTVFYTLVVVFIHCPHGGHGLVCGFLDHIFPGAITNVAVPFFFFCSGFLLVGHCDLSGWWRLALRKRVKSLLIPYFIINVTYWPLKYCVHTYLGGHGAGAMAISWKTPFEIIGVPFIGGPDDGPLWYIRCLMFFVLFSPVLVCLLKKSKFHAMVTCSATLLLYFLWEYVKPASFFSNSWREFLYYGFSLWGPIFFTIGMALRFWWNGRGRLGVGNFILLLGIAGCVSVSLMDLGMPSRWYFLPCLFVILGSVETVSDRRLPDWIVKTAFPLYVLHNPALYFIRCIFKALHINHWVYTWWGVSLLWVCCVVSVVLFTIAMKRLSPKLSEVIFGGR